MLRVGIVCDLKEEQWYSMDLVADMLVEQLQKAHSNNVQVTRLQPGLRRTCTLLPLTRNSKVAWNTDRLLNRAAYYPSWLRRRADKADVFHIVDHSYAQLAWQTMASRTVITCHDLDAFACLLNDRRRWPTWFRVYSRYVLSGMQRAAHIVCVSQTVKDAAVSNGLLNPEKISVIYNGVHPSYRPKPDSASDERVRKLLPFCSRTPLLLHVGSTIRRKRIDLLLNIFAQVRHELPAAKLIRVGGRLSPDQITLAANLGIGNDVIELPFLDRDCLAAVYRRCDLLLLPSESEGFGLPLIEAMACGCPVIASDIPAFREVGGEAAVFVELEALGSWRTAVLDVFEEIQTPASLFTRRTRCLANAARFDWARAASQLVGVYQLAART